VLQAELTNPAAVVPIFKNSRLSIFHGKSPFSQNILVENLQSTLVGLRLGGGDI